MHNLDEVRQLARSFQDRNAKLRAYQERKELETELKKLKIAIENENVEEDTKRDYYLKLLKSCILQAKDELQSLEMEKQCLAHMEVMKRDNPSHEKDHHHHRPPTRPLKPIIITKDAIQKAVYGAGYPSMPTMTVDEFYDQRVAEGIFPDEEQMKAMNKNSLMNRVYQDNEAEADKEAEQTEKLVDQDDEEYLARQRAKDEFKDEHRRGYGNRYNRS
jgi:immunoglobulin-binding protein 1